jgi:hypothetical protein
MNIGALNGMRWLLEGVAVLAAIIAIMHAVAALLAGQRRTAIP